MDDIRLDELVEKSREQIIKTNTNDQGDPIIFRFGESLRFGKNYYTNFSKDPSKTVSFITDVASK